MLTIKKQIIEKIYQNANSKNRSNIKKVENSIQLRKRFGVILFWPFYEIYLAIFNDE
tara:strand:- start:81 stop:251 length:171 start_codon:yes stop_codon:yes gene_type:complete